MYSKIKVVFLRPEINLLIRPKEKNIFSIGGGGGGFCLSKLYKLLIRCRLRDSIPTTTPLFTFQQYPGCNIQCQMVKFDIFKLLSQSTKIFLHYKYSCNYYTNMVKSNYFFYLILKIHFSITLVKNNEIQKHVILANHKFNIKHYLFFLSLNIQLLLCIEIRENVSDLEVLLTWITGRQQWCRKQVII